MNDGLRCALPILRVGGVGWTGETESGEVAGSFAVGGFMKRMGVCVVLMGVLSGCAGHIATSRYLQATKAYNACLLANPNTPAACDAEAQVVANDKAVYDDMVGP